jgi:REP element-mobilizing transposase RayT
MTEYRRLRIRGGTYFFTLVAQDRRSILAGDQAVDALRQAFRRVMAERPFVVEAIVILPDHLHAVWTLPEGDDDFSTRWRLVKYRFSLALPTRPTRCEAPCGAGGRRACGSGASGSTPYAMETIYADTWSTSTTTRSSTATWRVRGNGRSAALRASSRGALIRRIGGAAREPEALRGWVLE